MPQFIYQFLPGDRPELADSPDAWSPSDEAIASEHFAYLRRGLDAGILVLAGRAQEGAGPAIVIVETESIDTAEAFMESDPFVAKGLFRASLHPFRVALSRSVTP